MLREIILDTETTGLDPLQGHRIVEIGCLELHNHVSTGRTLHLYVNPERDMPIEAERVHGLTSSFLAEKPVFAEIVDQFLDFIADDRLVIHNAEFDMGFINAELVRCGFRQLPRDRAVDTLAIARRKFPGAQATLDALCRRYGIDLSARTLHGALLDAQLLAEVYLELVGGREPGLTLDARSADAAGTRGTVVGAPRVARPPRPHAPSAEELERHRAFIDRISDAIWKTLD